MSGYAKILPAYSGGEPLSRSSMVKKEIRS